MTRHDALEKYRKETESSILQTKDRFLQNMQEKSGDLAETLKTAISALREQTELLQKEKIMFIYFSLLRIDLLNGDYRVLAQALDARWYQDREPAEVEFRIDFLFSMFGELKEYLSMESLKYLGRVNTYDVDNMIQQTVMDCNGILAQQLRFMFRDIEENPDFAVMEKLDTWGIYWGEYRDKSEVVAHVDREKKVQLDWDRALRRTKNDETSLIFDFWYEAGLKDTDCSNKLLYFIQFENCKLEGLCFDGAILSGARFKNCTLKNCSFKNAVINQADFNACVWEDNDFTGAVLENSVFSEDGVPFTHLDPEQLQTILIDRRKDT